MHPKLFTLPATVALVCLVASCSPKQTEPASSASTQPPARPASVTSIPATNAAPVTTAPATVAPATPVPTPAPAADNQRPADAVSFNGHWYKAVDNKISWQDAKKACEELSGYLTCIETDKEQEFIAKLAEGRYLYLGATDEVKEDTWLWINGSAWAFTSWMEGQPNNYGGDEHYLATYDGGAWVDVAAEGSGFWMPIGYICEWDK